MAKSIGNYNINFGGNTAGISKATSVVESKIKSLDTKFSKLSFGDKLGGVSNKLKGVFDVSGASRFTAAIGGMSASLVALGAASAGAAVAIGGVIAAGTLAVSGLNRADEVADAADNLGISAANLSRLQFGGGQFGIEAEQVTNAIEKMNSSIADASTDNENLRKSFEELGLDVDKLKSGTPEVAFYAIADALSQVDNQFKKTQLARDIFGKAGGRFNAMLAQGSKGLLELARASDEAGATVTDSLAGRADSWDRAMKQLGASWNGFKNAFADSVIADFLTWVVNKTTELLGVINKVTGAITGATQPNVSSDLPAIGAGAQGLQGSANVGDGEGAKKALDNATKIKDIIGELQGDIAFLNNTPIKLEGTEELDDEANKLWRDLEKLGASTEDIVSALEKLGQKRELTKAFDIKSSEIRKLNDTKASLLDFIGAPVDDATAKTSQWLDLLEKGLITFGQYEAGVNKLGDELVKEIKLNVTEPPKALRVGSQEAATLVAQLQQDNKAESERKQQIELARQNVNATLALGRAVANQTMTLVVGN